MATCGVYFCYFLFLAYFYSLMSVLLWGLGCSHCVFPVFHTEEVLVRPQLGLSRLCEVKNDLLPLSPFPHSPLLRSPFPRSISGISEHSSTTRSRCLESCLQERGLRYFPLSFVHKHHDLTAMQHMVFVPTTTFISYWSE